MSQSFPANHEGETTAYTSCICNCGGTSQCVFKAHIKDGKVVAVEPDDRYNTGVGREDEVLTEADLAKVRLQRRPCTKGLVFYRYIYRPDRILYPLKRAPGSRRGDGKFVRISWDEALTTIADKMKYFKEKFGPYSVITPYMPNDTMERLFEMWGAGVDSWGWCSIDSTRLSAHLMTGAPGWEQAQYSSGSAADMLANTKLIVLWGFDPTVQHYGPAHQFAYFIKLARERGKRVILIEPRYTTAAEVLADQWIPIKPGTDHAMFLAMAYVIFKENLCDKEFLDKYVEPVGFDKWKRYVLGLDDGVEKTPEWAETICAVPAETTRELARLVATTKPSWLWCHSSLSRKSRGEQVVRSFSALQAMLGYWGTPGAGPSVCQGPHRGIPIEASWGPKGSYTVPKFYRSHFWAQAVLLLDKVRSGELKEDDYRRMVGWKADPALLKDFNPKMLMWGGGHKPHASDHLVTACESPNFQVAAFNKLEFAVTMHSVITPTVRYADIVLPAQDWAWEDRAITRSAYGGFECINFCPGVVKPPGEVKPWVWVYVKLAEKLGVDPKKFFRYYTTDQNWDKDWERYLRDGYQGVIDYYKKRNINAPSWEEFTAGKFINCDELDEQPFTGWDEQIKEGKPFKTASGKIEITCNYIADESKRGKGPHLDPFGRMYDNLPGDWGPMTPTPVFQFGVRGMNDPMVKDYPLMMLAPHGRYRVHYLFFNHPWLKDHVYQHRVWLSAADAGARGIKDGDMIEVYNDRGRAIMPAYVTNRVMPGIVVVRHGGWYEPDETGADRGASPSTLLGGDFTSCITPAKASNLVQVRKL